MQVSSGRPVGRIARNRQQYNTRNRRIPGIDPKKMLKTKVDPEMSMKTKANGKMSIAKLPDFARFRRELPASCTLSGDNLPEPSSYRSLHASAKGPFCRAPRERAMPYNGITREGIEKKGK
jgi:hypothetical protein